MKYYKTDIKPVWHYVNSIVFGFTTEQPGRILGGRDVYNIAKNKDN